MTKVMFKPVFKGGSLQHRPQVANRVLEADYYQQQEAERLAKKAIDKAKKPKRISGHVAIDDRSRQIAADLRRLPQGRVMTMHNLSRVTVDKILGEMDLGNL